MASLSSGYYEDVTGTRGDEERRASGEKRIAANVFSRPKSEKD
jgi:hypothetical protein